MPTPAPALEPDFSDLLHEFNERRVDYLVGGAHANAVNGGTPAATAALEILVAPTPANAERVLQALVAFGADISGLGKAELLDAGNRVSFGESPACVVIKASERDYGARNVVVVDDVSVNFTPP